MTQEYKTRYHYSEILEHLKSYFPAPQSDPAMDSYFVHAVSRFLNRVDGLKSDVPFLAGSTQENYYQHGLQSCFPEHSRSVEEITDMIADYCQGISVRTHPNSQLFIAPVPTISSITAFIAAAIYNPNLVTDKASVRFAQAEIRAVAMLSGLIGYNPQQSGGLFTFGGTGTILYACKIGLEKALHGRAMQDGVREDVKIFSSDTAHYARLNVAGWLGIGTKNLIALKSDDNNAMSVSDLENALRTSLAKGEKVAAIIATLGTTDTFGLDDVAAIVRLRDKLVQEYQLDYSPHVHADAVIGWAWSVFRDYDFQANPLGFHARTLHSLSDALQRIEGLQTADSIGIDFHKTGFAPYISSAFLLKNQQDFNCLSREGEQIPYPYAFGDYHPGMYSLECSRSGASALAALASMELLGKQGYRVLIGHLVEMAQLLRERLKQHSFIKILNDCNSGLVTLFRIYPQQIDAEDAFYQEQFNPDYREKLLVHNHYNRQIFDLIHARVMRGEGIMLSWTANYRHSHYNNAPEISALRSYIISPWTNPQAVALVIEQVLEARESL